MFFLVKFIAGLLCNVFQPAAVAKHFVALSTNGVSIMS